MFISFLWGVFVWGFLERGVFVQGLLSGGLCLGGFCPDTLFLRWKSFVLPFRSSSVLTAKISNIQPKTVRQKLNVLSVKKATHTKDAQIEKKSNQNVLIAKDHMLQIIKGVQLIKNRYSVNMWWTTKIAMPPF